VAIGATAVFGLIMGGTPWPLLLVAGLGAVWACIGISGAYTEKGLSALGLGLNIVPFIIAAAIGVTGIEGKTPQESPIEAMTPQQLREQRLLRQRQFIEQLRAERSGVQQPVIPVPQPESYEEEP